MGDTFVDSDARKETGHGSGASAPSDRSGSPRQPFTNEPQIDPYFEEPQIITPSQSPDPQHTVSNAWSRVALIIFILAVIGAAVGYFTLK